VTFWARERLLLTKTQILSKYHCNSQRAEQLNFLENGIFRQVGCGGLRAIKYHQYGRTHSLSRAVLTRLSRSWKRSPQDSLGSRTTPGRVLFAASGAAQDAVRTGSGGYLILCAFSPRPREASAADIPDTLFDWLEPGSQKIAQLEMPMIAHALIKRADSFSTTSRILVYRQCGHSDVPEAVQ
jgi:hypothetical protein